MNLNFIVGVSIGILLVAVICGVALEVWLLRASGRWRIYVPLLAISHAIVMVSCFFLITPHFRNQVDGLLMASAAAIIAGAISTSLVNRTLSTQRQLTPRGIAAGIAGMALSWLILAGCVYVSREGF